LYANDNTAALKLLDSAQIFAASRCSINIMADVASLREKERAENFPVALRVLPTRLRTHLTAVYAFARTVDDLGDEGPGSPADRLARLDAFDADLSTIWAGETPQEPVLRRLGSTVRACALPRRPFADLVEANRCDQRVTRYATYDDLRAYCALSADPVGHIVLGVFGVRDPVATELSDRICTGLQLVEHWQDVAEDRRAGRVYLPGADLVAFGVTEHDLDAAGRTPQPVRELLAFETDRAEALLRAGAPLVGRLHGWARLAIAGFVAGGLAAVDAIRRERFDVLRVTPRVRRADVLRHLVQLLIGRGRIA
jgi:squalene synthase HpnC